MNYRPKKIRASLGVATTLPPAASAILVAAATSAAAADRSDFSSPLRERIIDSAIRRVRAEWPQHFRGLK